MPRLEEEQIMNDQHMNDMKWTDFKKIVGTAGLAFLLRKKMGILVILFLKKISWKKNITSYSIKKSIWRAYIWYCKLPVFLLISKIVTRGLLWSKYF